MTKIYFQFSNAQQPGSSPFSAREYCISNSHNCTGHQIAEPESRIIHSKYKIKFKIKSTKAHKIWFVGCRLWVLTLLKTTPRIFWQFINNNMHFVGYNMTYTATPIIGSIEKHIKSKSAIGDRPLLVCMCMPHGNTLDCDRSTPLYRINVAIFINK